MRKTRVKGPHVKPKKKQKNNSGRQKASWGDALLNKERSSISHFNVRVSNVVGMDCAKALQRRGSERDAGGATDVLLPFQLTDTPLENTGKE